MRHLVLLFSIFLIFSCADNKSKEIITIEDTSNIQPDNIERTDYSEQSDRLIWSADFDTAKGNFVLKQHRKVNADTLSPEKLIKEFNSVWATQLVFRKISNDTIYVEIPDSERLTQHVGSTGAELYMSSATFILTELKGIKYVNYDFLEGDHLSPGTMSRESFKKFQ